MFISPLTVICALFAGLVSYFILKFFTKASTQTGSTNLGNTVEHHSSLLRLIILSGSTILVFYGVFYAIIMALGSVIGVGAFALVDGYGVIMGIFSGDPYGASSVDLISNNPLFIFLNTATVLALVAVITVAFVVRKTADSRNQIVVGTITQTIKIIFFILVFVFLSVLPTRAFYAVKAAQIFNNEHLCSSVGEEGLRGYCFGNIAIEKQDPNICSYASLEPESKCLVQYAQATKDTKACNALSYWKTVEGENSHRENFLLVYLGKCLDAVEVIAPAERCDYLLRMGPMSTEYLNQDPEWQACASDPRELGTTIIDSTLSDAAILKLLDGGADVNAQDRFGNTLVMRLVEYYENYSCDEPPLMEFTRLDLVKKLITTYHADLSVRESYGYTAFDLYQFAMKTYWISLTKQPITCTNPTLDQILKT